MRHMGALTLCPKFQVSCPHGLGAFLFKTWEEKAYWLTELIKSLGNDDIALFEKQPGYTKSV